MNMKYERKFVCFLLLTMWIQTMAHITNKYVLPTYTQTHGGSRMKTEKCPVLFLAPATRIKIF
jgi:hypothetical protein